MASTKLKPSDPRVEYRNATVRGKNYHYLFAKPEGQPKGTILLAHGFPDLSFGWRYQVPMLADLGLQVIVPDMLGYGGTDAPEEIEHYRFKSVAADLAELVAQIVPGEKIFLGGHDWGGVFVWRMALWHPDLIKAIVCLTPYNVPQAQYIDVETLGKLLPNFGYQKQFAGPELTREVKSEQRVRGFLNGLMGGRTPDNESPMVPGVGVVVERLDTVGRSPLLSEEESDFYTSQYLRNGLNPPLNWYRTRKFNYDDELELIKDGLPRIKIPSLLISAADDFAIPLKLSEGMEAHFDSLERVVVPGSHWVLFQSPEEVNKPFKEFLAKHLGLDAPPRASI